MSITRRGVLSWAAAAGAAALTGALPRRTGVATLALPNLSDTTGLDAVALHDGSAMSLAFARRIRASAMGTRVVARRVSLLTLEGFAAAGQLLDGTGGETVLALLDDADAVVLETLLRTRRAGSLVRRRYGGRVLLSARLSCTGGNAHG